MKYEVQGRVVGHSIFFPNPKDYPDLELVRISLTLSPATSNADKHTKAVLVVEKDAAWQDLVLGRIVRVTLQDSQQDAFLPPPSKRGEDDTKVEISVPGSGESVKTTVGGLKRTTAILEGRRGGRSRAH